MGRAWPLQLLRPNVAMSLLDILNVRGAAGISLGSKGRRTGGIVHEVVAVHDEAPVVLPPRRLGTTSIAAMAKRAQGP